MLAEIKNKIIKVIQEAGFGEDIELVLPPKKEMGDLALPCFVLAKKLNKNPVEAAQEIKNKLIALSASKDKALNLDLIEKVEATGPYVNFYLNPKFLAEFVISGIAKKGQNYAKNESGKGKKILVEFAQPNTHKAFHIGHLRGTITGESISRILENSGHSVVRVNYQGDVGMHIAKCLYGIKNSKTEIKKLKTIEDKVQFLGKSYAEGAQAFEINKKAEQEIIDLNGKIYDKNEDIKDLYERTRDWSLEYFDKIYHILDTKFNRLYFESEMSRSAVEIVKEFLRREVLKQSDGAVIYEGSKYGLHDRVFLNSLGLPTYEAKDLALAEKQFKEYNPDRIIHIVGKEQLEYFRVVFKVMEETLPKSKGKEIHLPYGWVSLKDGKMSSRTGKVVLGKWLIDEVNKKILAIMKDGSVEKKELIAEKVALGAVKYSFLKVGIKNDISFDLEESVSLAGDSGPYLMYIVARIKSILEKAGVHKPKSFLKKIFGSNDKLEIPDFVSKEEKQLLLKLAEFPEVIEVASKQLDPSKITHYLFNLAQLFNNFYHENPVLKAAKKEKEFRLRLISTVESVMTRGLDLLGIAIVEKM